MGRSRSRSRSRDRDRGRDRSLSSSSSSSEDSAEREERMQRERDDREERELKREQKKAAKKAARVQTAATAKAGLLQWRFLIKQDDPIDEDTFDVTLLASCPPELRVNSIVTAEDWGRLEPYLRESFEIPTSVKIGLQGKVLFSGKQALFFKVRDQPTLSTARFQIERLGQLLVDETEVTVEVEICAVDVGKKLKAKSKPRTRKQEASTTKLDELKSSIYGMTASTRSYVTGSWKPASSDIMRSEPEYLAKYFEGRGLTEKVMGNADYHPSPVVLICPFDSCKKSHRVLNGVSAVSQLYSHWKGRHASNPMAIALEKRWRLALDNKHKSKEWLDAQPGCALCLTCEEADRLGGEEAGYEQIRPPKPDPTDFKLTFDLNTEEHRAWKAAVGTI